MLGWYRLQLARRPLLTQSVTTAILFGTGDTLAQHAVEGQSLEKHDYARTGRMMLYGGAVFGPAATTWFSFLQRRVKLQNKNFEIICKVVPDQLLFASLNLTCFLSSMAVMEGSDPKEKLRTTWLDAYKRNLMLWPPIQFINFKYIPLEHRVLVVNFVSLGWNCYLSYINSKGQNDEKFEQPWGS